jgi:SPOR domain
MARSNGNQDRPGGQQGRQPYPAETVDHGLPWSNSHGANGSANAPPPGYDPHAAGQLPWPQAQQPFAQGYQQPPHTAPPQHSHGQQYHGQPMGAQAYVPPQYPQPLAYAPQPDAHHGHYFPQSAQVPQDLGQAGIYQQAGYAPQPGYHDPAAQLRGSFPGHGEAPYGAPPAQQGHDPRQFDLGAYGNPSGGYADPVTGRPFAQAPSQPGLPVSAQQAPFGKATGAPAAQEALDDDQYEDEDEEEVPRKRFGLVKVLGVLVLAVGIGGGAAYGVKKFGGSLLTAGTKPVTVKADTNPTKSKPVAVAAAGDSKAAERLGGGAVPAVVPAGGDAQGDTPGSPRRVQTVAIAPPAASLRPTVSIPGVTVEGGLPLAPPAAAPQPSQALPPVTQAPPGRAVAPPPVAALPQRAPVAPKVIAAVEEPAAAPKAPPAARVPVAKPPRQSDAYQPASGVGAATVAAATTPPAAAAAARPVTGNGYIAVLKSTPSAIDARKALDDFQGRYAESIGGKPTDVREFVNPSDGQTYYRAVVGPPGSFEAAKAICAQMKTAGLQGCFAAAY